MQETISYLEMTDPGELSPAPSVNGVTLEKAEAGSRLIQSVIVRIGAPYEWRVATWSDQAWTNWLASSSREAWFIRFGTEVAGIAEYERHPNANVEITTFGLVPEFVGKGIGGYGLTLALQQAWQAAPDVARVWLHTSSLDHPAALPNYQKRGLRIFRTEIKQPL